MTKETELKFAFNAKRKNAHRRAEIIRKGILPESYVKISPVLNMATAVIRTRRWNKCCMDGAQIQIMDKILFGFRN